MIKKLGMILLGLALAGLTGARTSATKEADGPSGPGNEGYRGGALKTGNDSAQNDVTDEKDNAQVSAEELGSKSRFERVPADEQRLIREMADILQEKMSRDYRKGQTRRDAHPKTLACLQAEFIVEPNIPAALKVGIFAAPQTYPAWIRISSSSGRIQSDKVKDVRGLAIKITGVKGERFREAQRGERNPGLSIDEPPCDAVRNGRTVS